MESMSNDLLKKFQETIFNASWMNEMYGQERVDQQKKLKGVFSIVTENNISASEKKNLEAKAETIQEKVERLEAKMAVLEETLAKNAEIIEKHAKEITDLIAQAGDKSEELEDKQKEVVKNAVEDVFYYLEQGKIGRDAVVGEIRRRIEASDIADKYGKQVEKILGRLDAKKAEVSNLVNEADKWIAQKQILQAQYGSTKSTYDLLKACIGRVGATETNYTNSDFDKNIPIYSPEKVGVVSEISENPAINVPAGENKNYVEGGDSKTNSLDKINEKYAGLLKTDKKAIQNLDKALNMGLINDLAAAGINSQEAMKFIGENFSNANIRYTGTSIKIPNGSGQAAVVYTKLTTELERYNSSIFQGALNTWDKEGGNTIDSNAQIKSLSENYETILETLGNGDPKFTFKEAMYALFDPDHGIFKDSGVVYNVDKQSETPNYFIELAGDKATADMYKNMSQKIFDIWGVRPSRGISSEQYEDDNDDSFKPEETPDIDAPSIEKPSIERTDPIWFNLDDDENNKFSFVIDRDNDGKFTNQEDFVGGSEDKTWLEDLKSLDTNNDGKLNGDELKNLKILGTDFNKAGSVTDNNVYDPNKNQSDKGFNRQETTQVNYTLTNAQSMGIEEIDLNNLENNVNKSQNIFDANGSEKFDDSFSFKMNGEEVTAHRQDETNTFMDAIYKDAYGKGFNISLSDTEVDDVFKKDYGEFDQFNGKYADVFTNIGILKNAGNIAQEARETYQDTLERIEAHKNVELIKAGNKAASKASVGGWNSIKDKVMALVTQQGLQYNEEQLKGIYVLDGSLDAYGVVEKYKSQVAKEKDVSQGVAMRKEAWSAIILCAKNGIVPDASVIKELLSSKKAHSAQDIVNILKKENPKQEIDVELVTREIGFDSDREKEIFEAFNNVFNNAGLDDKVVDALAELCVAQQEDRSYMIDKSGEELAQKFLEKYQG